MTGNDIVELWGYYLTEQDAIYSQSMVEMLVRLV